VPSYIDDSDSWRRNLVAIARPDRRLCKLRPYPSRWRKDCVLGKTLEGR